MPTGRLGQDVAGTLVQRVALALGPKLAQAAGAAANAALDLCQGFISGGSSQATNRRSVDSLPSPFTISPQQPAGVLPQDEPPAVLIVLKTVLDGLSLASLRYERVVAAEENTF